MKELKGTRTEQNLATAFAGESQAHTKYLYYASKAKKDGYVQMGNIFEETARNEKEHAKLWFKYLHGGEVPSTPDNLADAAAGENMNGLICMPPLQRRHAKKALLKSLLSLRWWVPSKKVMKRVTANC